MAAALLGSERLLVWMPRWLGDFQMAEPTVAALAAHFGPRADRLTLALPRAFRPLLDSASFDLAPGLAKLALVDLDRGPSASGSSAFQSALEASDVALLLPGSFRCAWRTWRAGVPRRIGWARDGRGALLTDGMRPAREAGGRSPRLGSRVLPRPYSTASQELLAGLGVPVRRTAPLLRPRPALMAALTQRLASAGLEPGRPFLTLNVGGRAGSAKAYPDWSGVLTRLLEAGTAVVGVTGPAEEARFDELGLAAGAHGRGLWLPLGSSPEAGSQRTRRDPNVEIASVANETRSHPTGYPVASLPELAALGASATVCITTDGGPRHLFDAAGGRTLVLFGPTDPRHTAGHLARTESLVGRVACGPCHEERCPQPTADERACFRAIDPEAIVRAALSYGRAD